MVFLLFTKRIQNTDKHLGSTSRAGTVYSTYSVRYLAMIASMTRCIHTRHHE